MQSGDWKGWAPTAFLGGRLGGRRLGILGHGADRSGGGAARAGLRDAGPLPQPQAPAPRGRGRAGGDLVGKPRPDGRADGRAVRQLPAHARDLSPDERAAAEADETDGRDREHLARRGDRRERPDAGAARRARSRARGWTSSSTGTRSTRACGPAECGAAAAYGSATVEGRIEMGEKVIINIKTFADGHRPPDQVVPGML